MPTITSIGENESFVERNSNKWLSLGRMADNKNCSLEDVMLLFQAELMSNNLTKNEIMKSISFFRDNKLTESIEFQIHPEDTCSAFMEKWAIDLHNNYEHYKNLQNSAGKTKENYLAICELLINKVFTKHMTQYLNSDYPFKDTRLASISILGELVSLKEEITENTRRDNELNKKSGNHYLEDYENNNLINQAFDKIRKEILGT